MAESRKYGNARNARNRNIVAYSAIIGAVLVILIVVLTIPYWGKNLGNVQTAQAAINQTEDVGIEDFSSPHEYSENTIMDSQSGKVIIIPPSDPESSSTIRDSRSANEVPVPSSDPGN